MHELVIKPPAATKKSHMLKAPDTKRESAEETENEDEEHEPDDVTNPWDRVFRSLTRPAANSTMNHFMDT